MCLWQHPQQEIEAIEIHINTLAKSGSDFGVDVCVFAFALAIIGKVFKPRSNGLFNLDGFRVALSHSFMVGPSWLLNSFYLASRLFPYGLFGMVLTWDGEI